MPWPTRKPPVQCSPRRPRASSFSSSDRHVPARALQLERDSRADPAAADHDRFHVARQRSSLSTLRRQACSGAASSSSSTDCGNATISTSHGARRRTKSTVGEKNRDCRRQRGAEPRTIRSASDLERPLDDRLADRARADRRADDLDAVLLAEQLRLGERRLGPLRPPRPARRVERLLERDADHVQRLDLARSCSPASFTAVAIISSPMMPELHRHEDPLELRGRAAARARRAP